MDFEKINIIYNEDRKFDKEKNINTINDLKYGKPIIDYINPIILKWCSDEKIIVGENGINIYLNHQFNIRNTQCKTPLYLNFMIPSKDIESKLFSLDKAISSSKIISIFNKWKKLYDPSLKDLHIKTDKIKSEKVLKIIDVFHSPTYNYVLVNIQKITIAQIYTYKKENSIPIPIEELTIKTNEESKSHKLKVNIISLEWMISRYLMLCSIRKISWNDLTFNDVINNLDIIYNILRESKKIPPPLEFINYKESLKLQKQLQKIVPLYDNCFYAGSTAIKILNGKLDLDSDTVEIASFGNTTQIVYNYINEHSYQSYDIDFHWRWSEYPSIIILEPESHTFSEDERKSIIPFIRIYDCSTIAGYKFQNLVSIINLSFCTMPNISMKILSTIYEKASTILSTIPEEEDTGNNVSSLYLLMMSSNKINRLNYISNVEFIKSAIYQQQKQDLVKFRGEH